MPGQERRPGPLFILAWDAVNSGQEPTASGQNTFAPAGRRRTPAPWQAALIVELVVAGRNGMLATMQTWTGWLGFLVVCYLCGAVPFGLIVGLLKGVDIRTRGSGNIGATNAGRVLGRPCGILVFALDVAKGWAPVAAGGILLRLWRAGSADTVAIDPATCLAWLAMGGACILGHMFPIYLKFKGGKGVATSLGVVLGIYPYYLWAGLAALVLWVLVTGLTRYVSLGSMVAALAFPVIFAALAHARAESWGSPGRLWPLHAFAVVVGLLVVYRHRGNLRRLIAGTESRIGQSARSAG